MDLAFLLIAVLVLLVDEPVKEKFPIEKLAQLEIRHTAAKVVEDKKLVGGSIWLRQAKDGSIYKLLDESSGSVLWRHPYVSVKPFSIRIS